MRLNKQKRRKDSTSAKYKKTELVVLWFYLSHLSST